MRRRRCHRPSTPPVAASVGENGKREKGPSEAAAGGGPPEGSISGDPGLRVVGKRGGGGGEG